MMNAVKSYSRNAAKMSDASFDARRDLVIVGGIALAVSLIFSLVSIISIIIVVAVLSIRLTVVQRDKSLIGASL